MSIEAQLNPFDLFVDASGTALDAGYIYIGQVNRDPRTYPATAYFDAAQTIPAPMPLRTVSGYVYRNGTPALIYISGNYSVMVLDKNGAQVYYLPDVLLIGNSSATTFGDVIRVVDNPAAVRSLPKAGGSTQVSTRYFSTPGDGGNAIFSYDPTDTTSADNGGSLLVALDGGRWKSISNSLSIRQFGAKGDGVTGCSAAIAATDAAGGFTGGVLIPPGTYLIEANLNVAGQVTVMPGAILKRASGVTVTFQGGINANLHQIFSSPAGAGGFFFTPGTLDHAYPEWWQASTNTTDWLASLQAACLSGVALVILQARKYIISDVLKLAISYFTLKGKASWQRGTSTRPTTQIYSSSATADVIQVGPATPPGPSPDGDVIGNFSCNVNIEDLEVGRTVLPVAAAVGFEVNSPAGIRTQNSVETQVNRVHSTGHCIGFAWKYTVGCKNSECRAMRYNANKSVANDHFWGYHADGDAPFLGSGNSSLRIFDGKVTGASDAANVIIGSIGFRTFYYFSDIFLDGFEIDHVQIGIDCFGVYQKSGVDTTTPQYKSANTDFLIHRYVADACLIGARFRNLSEYSAVSMLQCTLNPSGGATGSGSGAIYIGNSVGMFSIASTTGILWQNSDLDFSADNFGLWIDSSNGVSSQGNMWLGARKPIQLTNASFCTIVDEIKNPTQTTPQAAVYVSASINNEIRPMISGGANVFPAGIELVGTTCASNELTDRKINGGSITGGVKAIVYNGAATTTRTFGSGNVVTTR